MSNFCFLKKVSLIQFFFFKKIMAEAADEKYFDDECWIFAPSSSSPGLSRITEDWIAKETYYYWHDTRQYLEAADYETIHDVVAQVDSERVVGIVFGNSTGKHMIQARNPYHSSNENITECGSIYFNELNPRLGPHTARWLLVEGNGVDFGENTGND